MTEQHPTIRWGIVATGMISSWFVSDLVLPTWPGKRANHVIAVIGSSSLEKAEKFYEDNIKPASQYNENNTKPKLYGDYESVYKSDEVDVVYIGTPHSFHKKNMLDAIAAGKNILCEKPFTLNLKETEEVFEAAKKKGVYIMEAMWTRFYPLVSSLQKLLNEDKIIGNIWRTYADFGLDTDITKLPKTSRLVDPALGAGSLLDIGIYSLTWGLLTLSDGKVGDEAEEPKVIGAQTLQNDVDVISSWILTYPSTGRHGILTSTTNYKTPETFGRIEGSKGYITIDGATSSPESFTVYLNGEKEGKKYEFEKPGRGFFWEADAVAWDIKEGKKENALVPWKETERVMRILDNIRKQGGAKFPVDDW